VGNLEEYGALLRSQLGTHESPPSSNNVAYTRWYYGTPTPPAAAAWCLILQDWAHVKVGLEPPGYDPATAPRGTAYTPAGAAWFRARGRWHATPQVGDLVFYDFPGDGVNRISHVGWVEQVTATTITAIEGNTNSAGSRDGGAVLRKVRARGPAIVGYGRPDYEEADVPLSDADRTWIAAKLEASERRIARYVDHGDAAVAGSSNHHKRLLEELAGLPAAVAAALAGAPATPAPAGEPLTAEELGELADLFVARLVAGGFNLRGEVMLSPTTAPPA
jgi:hypothetical protein